MRKSFLRSMAQLLVGCLLFAQLAVAAYVCPGSFSMQRNMSLARSTEIGADKGSINVAGQSPTHCGDMAMNMLDPQNPHLCAEHCKFGQQSDQAFTLEVPIAMLLALYFVLPESVLKGRLGPTAAPSSTLIVASPPHAILHCCFRI